MRSCHDTICGNTVAEDHACKHCFKNETITLQTGERVTIWRMDFIE